MKLKDELLILAERIPDDTPDNMRAKGIIYSMVGAIENESLDLLAGFVNEFNDMIINAAEEEVDELILEEEFIKEIEDIINQAKEEAEFDPISFIKIINKSESAEEDG